VGNDTNLRYSAYISYNHADSAIAKWVHHQLETYRIQKHLRGRDSPVGILGQKLPPVFRDRDELASSADLGKSVRDALVQSATLIVICSPNGAQSRWVNEEIRTFRALGRANRIQCLIVAGEPHAARNATLDAKLECFPPALFEDADDEPLAADLRLGQDGKHAAKLKLLAGIMDVGYDDLRQREAERRQRRLAAIAAGSGAGLLITSALAVFALWQRSEAITQRDIARQKTLTAQRTVEFVKSLFEVADPSEAQGSTITVREILDQGARRISASLNDEPSVKAELTTTLSEVYGSLGLLRQSDALARSAFTIRGRDSSADVKQYAVLGESQVRLANYSEAITSFNNGLKIARITTSNGEAPTSRLLIGLSEAQSAIEDYSGAEKSANSALKIDESQYGVGDPATGRAIEAIGENAFYAGSLNVARSKFQLANAIRIRAQGSQHPRVTTNYNFLGSIAYLQGNPALAERYYRQVLADRVTVLGAEHPSLGVTLNNLSRVLIEQRKFTDTLPMAERAVAIDLKQRDATHDDMAFLFANLAIVKHGLGNPSAAEPLFRKALTAARLHKHRNLAPILTDLANTLCDLGRASEAMPLLAEARPIMTKTYPKDPWRPAWTDFVHGRCLIKSGDRAGGLALIRASTPALQKRWKPDSLYGHTVARTLAANR
jgi:tetratricopeptide (TPR) repeat protein